MLSDQRKSELCLSCGECCKTLYVYLPQPDTFNYLAMQKEFTKARGMRRMKDLDRPGYYAFAIPARCPHLLADNRCDIYETRPLACSRYQGDQDMGVDCAWRKEV